VGQERGPLSLVSTIKELPERKSSSFGLEIWEYGRRDASRWPRGSLYPQELALTSPTSGGRSVGIVSSRTQATEFFLFLLFFFYFFIILATLSRLHQAATEWQDPMTLQSFRFCNPWEGQRAEYHFWFRAYEAYCIKRDSATELWSRSTWQLRSPWRQFVLPFHVQVSKVYNTLKPVRCPTNALPPLKWLGHTSRPLNYKDSNDSVGTYAYNSHIHSVPASKSRLSITLHFTTENFHIHFHKDAFVCLNNGLNPFLFRENVDF
jgi:hypothetical protein